MMTDTMKHGVNGSFVVVGLKTETEKQRLYVFDTVSF